MNTKEKLKKLYETMDLAEKYYHAVGLINFDLETISPENAKEEQGEVINFLSNEAFKLTNSEEYNSLIVDLYNSREDLDPLDKVMIEKKYDNYLKIKNITPEFALYMDRVYTKSFLNWLKAKEAADFSVFRDSLAEVIELEKKTISLRENKLPDTYDNLLNDCEKGMLTEQLDRFFGELKAGLLEIMYKIKNSKHVIRDDFLTRKVPLHKQEIMSKYLLELNGYDFKKGVLAESEHPFTSDIAKNDARLTTHYHEDMVLSNIFSVIHEGGHGIFMQNEREEDYEHHINDSITNGMHESVSRFYENVIGRSKEYVHLIYPKFMELFSEELGDVSERELYEALNIVKPSLIRTEADEVTYGLHVIIRYEMEKMIMHDEIKVDDIPKMWNRLYKEYLGIEPSNDREGVLQDMHWSSGFGYFPSYAMGNSYNAMYVRKMKEEIDFEGAVSRGQMNIIKAWLKDNVFSHANVLTPDEWIREITGESLTPKYFLEYLNKKYSEIYEF